MTGEVSWNRPTDFPAIGPEEVHLWLADLRCLHPEHDRLGATLDESERRRADRFRSPADRTRWVLSRGLLRALLARYLDRPAEAIRFERSSHGKPLLPEESGEGSLQFNLSHSEDVALLAVCRRRRVGVDVEAIRAARATREIAERFFAREELQALATLPSEEWTEAFFACWTRKEAYLKARGVGLSAPLSSFAVSVSPGEAPVLRRSELGDAEVARWSFANVSPRPGFAAALAVEGRTLRLERWVVGSDLLSRL